MLHSRTTQSWIHQMLTMRHFWVLSKWQDSLTSTHQKESWHSRSRSSNRGALLSRTGKKLNRRNRKRTHGEILTQSQIWSMRMTWWVEVMSLMLQLHSAAKTIGLCQASHARTAHAARRSNTKVHRVLLSLKQAKLNLAVVNATSEMHLDARVALT